MNDNLSFKLYHLMQFKGMNRRKIHAYLSYDPMLERINQHSPTELQQTFHLHPSQATSLHYYLNSKRHIELNYLDYKKENPITFFDSDYPIELREIPDSPLILYWKGNKELLRMPKVSIIGTRNPSQSASHKIDLFLKPTVENNIAIVSGLAYGIDAMAHQYALSHNGSTIAILGFGYHHIYPKEHQLLFNKIIESGLILTEYHPKLRPQKWYFPERNRIISGLSAATIIIEASERSGTMITADQALEQGKEVFSIPDSIFLDQAQGCLKLIQDGAIPLVKPEELTNWYVENHLIYLQEKV
ncbi:DNA-protecting protein DprA [Filobacillus milosensis]|uniref:DNA-protecting protein DprA n=1 Tax=Filobacillus milosensis TaxID=94137 RepID=A0A4Y8INR6_9BACI|nr:DNA-processing protein DprA [Filobacillus milosensis]TFB23223.1 DNA-protecting protein DprA [Filobacillus milosensis]